MKRKSVVIVVLLYFYLSFGYGDKSISNARVSLRRRYGLLNFFLRDPNILSPRGTVAQHLAEVEDKWRRHQAWIQKISGYSHEQLSSPPESFMNEDLLKLATEYHLWKAGWYYVRFLSLKKAAYRERGQKLDKKYPGRYLCSVSASKAYKLSDDHKQKYLRGYTALSEAARQDLMEEIELPSYTASQELIHNHPENQYYTDFQWLNHESAESDALLNVKAYLRHLINRLLKRKESTAVFSEGSIAFMMSPSGRKLKKSLISKIREFSPVENLSLSPDNSPRGGKEFLEVAWLFNHYKSLWHQKRYQEFLKFLPHWKKGKSGFSIKRLKKAIKLEKKGFKHYKVLYEGYFKKLNDYQRDAMAMVRNPSPAPDYIDVDGTSHEQIQWRGKRKRTTLRSVRKLIYGKTGDLEKHQSFEESVQPAPDESGAFETVDTNVNGQPEDDDFHESKQYKYEKVYVRRRRNQAGQQKSSDEQGQSDFDRPAASRTEEDPQNPLLTEVVQQFTIPDHEDIGHAEIRASDDFRFTDEEHLQELCKSFWQYSESDILFTNNVRVSPASMMPEEQHCQQNSFLLINENQLETDATEVQVRENQHGLKELQGSEPSVCTPSTVGVWLTDNFERTVDDSLAENVMKDSVQPVEYGVQFFKVTDEVHDGQWLDENYMSNVLNDAHGDSRSASRQSNS